MKQESKAYRSPENVPIQEIQVLTNEEPKRRLGREVSILTGITVFLTAAFSGAVYAETHGGTNATQPEELVTPTVELTENAISYDNLTIDQSYFQLAPEVAPSPEVIGPPTVYWIFAHEDDETLAAAGAMKDSQDAGNKNIVIWVSSGQRTAVGPRLGLTPEQTTAARIAEGKAALSIIGITDVRDLGMPEGTITVDYVKGVVEDLIANTKGKVFFRTHSPYDSYLGLPCGHVDHCAVGTALVQMFQAGEIKDLKVYREGQFFGSAKVGDCPPLTRNQLTAKQLMKQEYSKVDRSHGRYGIAYQSVPGAWNQAMVQPECSESPR